MLKRLLGLTAALALVIAALPAGASAAEGMDALVAHDLKFAGAQLKRARKEVRRHSYPQETRRNGRWKQHRCCPWTAGFFPGSLWLMYEATGDHRWRAAARRRQAGIEPEKSNTTTHDLGLMVYDSFGQGYRLTRNRRFRRVVLTAARSLATRYSRRVRAIRSWNNRLGRHPTDFRVIVDSMMNLELLFKASRQGGRHHRHRGLRSKALQHALTVAWAHVRADGSTYHLVVFNSRNGKVRRRRTVQGYSNSSTWARGQAWAIHGFTTAYRESHDWRMLDTARRVAGYYVSHLPADSVPYWDFNAPGIPDAPRDSSAAAIAASGLIQLSELDPDPELRERYLATAEATLRALSRKGYLAKGTRSRSILLHGTADKPKGNYNRGLIYGDYFFLEALLRYRALESARDRAAARVPPPGDVRSAAR